MERAMEQQTETLQPRILIVEDDPTLRRIAEFRLGEAGYEVVLAVDGDAGLEAFSRVAPDLVITDLRMPGLSGAELASEILRLEPSTPVIVMTGHGTVASAVEAMRKGVADYVTKPVSWDEMLVVVAKELARAALTRENRVLRASLKTRHTFASIIGESAAIRAVFAEMDRLKDVAATVLIEGESGTGKELVARALHFEGSRSAGPFIAVNCGAIPGELLESELFGHEKGAFTGAGRVHRGYFEQADGGTLFLDEIGEIPPAAQVTLLRVLTDRRIRRVGAETTIPVDVRVVAATNRNLAAAMDDGDFRSDLYYRIAVVPVRLPALRERGADVVLLAEHFASKAAGRRIRICPEAAAVLTRYPWRGNVRELENVMERAVVLGCTDAVLREADLPEEVKSVRRLASSDGPFPEEGVDLALVERDWIQRALDHTSGNRSRAARMLGITRQALLYRIQKYSIAAPPETQGT
jgi:DNA-binding NtrC family response regulator